MRIAILEDEAIQAELLKTWLEAAGYRCHLFQTGKSLLQACKRESFDLLIIDWELPGLSGLEVIQQLRRQLDWPIPVLMATNRAQEEDVVAALEGGADDYMIKPIGRVEMLARIKALSRRSHGDEARDTLEVPPYHFSRPDLSVRYGDTTVQLATKEFNLALFLFNHAGRLLSRGYILENVWGQRADLNTRTVDAHISQLRQKLAITPANGWKLSSVYGHGYRLEQMTSS